MKVTIEISDADARMMRSWASLGRHCDSITRVTDKIFEGTVVDSDLADEAYWVEEAVKQLKPALSNVHFALRAVLIEAGVKPLWDQNQG